ncbi:MAG: SDR family oxidoreductase [Actinomycetota bacterium]
MQYEGSHAIVTGGSSGIGRALVAILAERGAQVSVIARGAEALHAVVTENAHCDGAVTAHVADVGDEVQVIAAIAKAVDGHGPCDLLIASAGVSRPGHFLEMPDGEFERHMRVNYFGTLYAMRAVAPSMMERGTGSMVALSSAAGLLGVFGYSAYGSTKYAVRGLCDVLRTEMKPHGVHVGCAFPADVDTPQFHGERPYMPDEALAISGTVKPISAEKAAVAILRGVDKHKANIFTDPTTTVLDRLVRIAPGLTRRWLDRRVSTVKKDQ